MFFISRIVILFVGLALFATTSRAEEKAKGTTKGLQPIGLGEFADSTVVTKHKISAGGQTLNYSVTTGYLEMQTERGQHKASIFYIAYTKDGVSDAADRPITFAFNGGPGSSSVWLHLGALGPKRVLLSDEGEALKPPYRLVDNEYTWLTASDLVFIDPVGTGYSRPAPDEKREQFHGVDEDVRSVGDFIRLYTTRYKRWRSAKFLAGESYGTTRAAGLAGYLQNRYGMNLNGLMLVSSILQFSTARFDPGNDWPYILFLPTYTATAWYHNKLAPELQRDLQSTLRRVERFAMDDYLPALAKGSAINSKEFNKIVDSLTFYTGLSRSYVGNTDLRINIHYFCKELLRDEHRTVGRLDSRFKGIDGDNVGPWMEHDPSLTAIAGPYTACLNSYLREDLQYVNDLPYEILTGRVRPWNWGNAAKGYVNVGETLREAMSKNTNLKVWISSGYYDLATPYFATEFTVNHLGLRPDLQQNVQLTYYESGHMMYIRMVDLKAFSADALRFIDSAK